MTKTSRWFIAITLIFLLAGIYTGDRIYFIGLGICSSILLYSLITNIWVLADFKYMQSITPSRVVKGNPALLQIEIHNDKLFIYPFIKVHYQVLDSQITGHIKTSLCGILPFKRHVISEEIDCIIRGRFALGITKVEVSDIFGLFSFSMDLTSKSYHRPLYLDVWPRILNLTKLPIPQIDQEGSQNTAMMNSQEFSNISSIRQYRFGDPLKKIHWKVSSKFQEILVKEYETNTQPDVHLFVETNYSLRGDFVYYQIQDQVIECSTAIIHYLLSNWIPVQLIAYTDTRHNLIGKNHQDFDNIYGFLANLSFSSPFSMAEVLRMEYHKLNRGSGLFLVVQHLVAELFNILFQIKESGVSVLLFYVKDPDKNDRHDKQIIDELTEKGITTIVVDTDNRLDKVLEAF